jgi:hypothetical protein
MCGTVLDQPIDMQEAGRPVRTVEMGEDRTPEAELGPGADGRRPEEQVMVGPVLDMGDRNAAVTRPLRQQEDASQRFAAADLQNPHRRGGKGAERRLYKPRFGKGIGLRRQQRRPIACE